MFNDSVNGIKFIREVFIYFKRPYGRLLSFKEISEEVGVFSPFPIDGNLTFLTRGRFVSCDKLERVPVLFRETSEEMSVFYPKR
jgi:hypothetical protein